MRVRASDSTAGILPFALLVCAFFFSFFYRISAAVVLPQLATEWSMSATLTGLISSLYFYSYALMQPLSGVLNDRHEPLFIGSVGLVVTAGGALCFAFAQVPATIAVGRLLTGLGLSSFLSGAVAYQNATFPPEKYAFYSGLTLLVGNLGAAVSVSPLGAALDRWGRASVFSVLCVVTLGLAAAMFSLRRRDIVVIAIKVRHRKDGLSESELAERKPAQDNGAGQSLAVQLKSAFLTVARSWPLRSIILVWFVSFGALMSAQGLWAVEWCKAAYAASDATARGWSSMFTLGVMAGNALGSRMAAGIEARRAAVSYSSLACAIAWAMLWVGIGLSWPLALTAVFALFVGAASGFSYTHMTAAVSNLAPVGQRGSIFGVVNAFPSLGAIAMQWATGSILSAHQPAEIAVSASAILYSKSGFQVAFAFVIATVIISQLALIGLRNFEREAKAAS